MLPTDQIAARHHLLENVFSNWPFQRSPLVASWGLSNKQIPMTNVRKQNCSGIMCLRLCKSSFEIYPPPRNPLGMAGAAFLIPFTALFFFLCVCVIIFF